MSSARRMESAKSEPRLTQPSGLLQLLGVYNRARPPTRRFEGTGVSVNISALRLYGLTRTVTATLHLNKEKATVLSAVQESFHYIAAARVNSRPEEERRELVSALNVLLIPQKASTSKAGQAPGGQQQRRTTNTQPLPVCAPPT